VRDLADELLQAKVRARLFGGDHAPRLGRLVILDRIGAGAMGTVYAAYDPRLDRKVAVKILHAGDPDASARFLRECRALARLAHPNIVTIHDAGDDTGAVHVVMELATGVPLRAWIDNPARTWRDVLRVMVEIAAGLAAAHQANIVHRDVKPDNILVGDDRARLVDFGLADRAFAPDPAEPTTEAEALATAPTGAQQLAITDQFAATEARSLDDLLAGTPSYMAPEVLAGEGASPASDQFSFAVTLFEALYGERPHHGTTRGELREAARHAAEAVRRARTTGTGRPKDSRASHEPTEVSEQARGDETVLSATTTVPFARQASPVEGVPPWVDAVLRRALAADPADRFPSMDALAAELLRDRRRRRRTAAVAGVGMIAIAIVGLIAYRAGGEAAGSVDPVSCDGHARIAAAWNPRRADAIRAGFGDVPWTDTTLGALDGAATAWESSFRSVCEATRVRGEQSDRLLELRMRCLDRALDRFDALAGALEVPLDGSARAEAPSTIAELPSAAACRSLTDDAALALPGDPAARTEALSIERELDHAWAAYSLGRYYGARTRARALAERVAKLDLPALRASVLLLAASIESRTGEATRARKTLDTAAVLAARARAPELELAVWTRVLRQELFSGHYDRVIEWAATGEAAAGRAGHEGADVSSIVGEAYRLAGQLDAARARLRAALDSRDRLRDDQRALIEMNLGSIELALGKSDDARAIYERAAELARHALGDGHPTIAIHLDRLAEVDRVRGRLGAALALHARSRELRSRAFGDTDRAVATARLHRAETLLEAGRLDEAFAEATAARGIRENALGARSVRIGEVDALLGDIELERGRLAEARARYDHGTRLTRDVDVPRRLLAIELSSDPSGPRGPLDPVRVGKLARQLGLTIDPEQLADDAAVLEPFTADRVAATAVRLSLLPAARAAPLRAAMVARYRHTPHLDPEIALAIGDAALAAGDRATALTAYNDALARIADEPSRARLHALRGLATSADGAAAATWSTRATAVAAAMPELAAR